MNNETSFKHFDHEQNNKIIRKKRIVEVAIWFKKGVIKTSSNGSIVIFISPRKVEITKRKHKKQDVCLLLKMP